MGARDKHHPQIKLRGQLPLLWVMAMAMFSIHFKQHQVISLPTNEIVKRETKEKKTINPLPLLVGGLARENMESHKHPKLVLNKK